MRVKLTVAGMLLAMAVSGAAAADLERRAAEAVAAHQLVEARRLYRTLAERDPTHIGHHVWVGRLSSWLSDYAAAQAAFDHVLARDAGNAEALVGKAYVAMWQEQFAEADALLTRAEVASPNDAEVQLALARNHHFQGQEGAAIARVERVLALEPGRAEALDLKRRLAPEPKRLSFFARLKRILTGRS
jgi:tetratricopeptide (TPR) repeat protein